MADNKKTTGKVTKQASANKFLEKSDNSKSSNTKKAVGVGVAVGATALAVKRLSGKTIIAIVLTFILTLAIGFGAYYFFNKNDCFEIVGNDEVTLTIGDKYADEGVKIIEFGKDISDKVIIKTDMQKDESGNYYGTEEKTYYIEYSTDTFKMGKIYSIKKIRLVSFVAESEGGE